MIILHTQWQIPRSLLQTLISALINDYIHYTAWEGIIYPFPNFNGVAVEVLEMQKKYYPTL